MQGRDLMATAQTGSGKTGAFLIPVINYLMDTEQLAPEYCRPPILPKCVCIAPTRELAQQIYDDAMMLCGENTGIRPRLIYGQASSRAQMNNMQKGTSILIATIGRLNDFLGKSHVQLTNCEFFILDEADRMLDMGEYSFTIYKNCNFYF